MAICYARLEFLKRTSGKNAVAKSAYNSRDKAHFEGNQLMAEKTYSWLGKEKPAYHQIMLPGHVDRAYLSAEFLWNAVEKAERKKNAVVGSEVVLALPDDDAITLEDKIQLTKTFVHQNFISKGFAAQIDIHSPENAIANPEVAEEEKGSNNWHAHIQITPRRFLKDGKTFEKNKPRENVTELRGGRVISGLNWGKLWTQHQNEYFEQKGLNLRVDPSGVVPQKHLGPCRMRGRAFSLLSENDALIEFNQLESSDPQKILGKIIETKSVFSKEEVDLFFQKHVPTNKLEKAKEEFWALEEIVELFDKQAQQKTHLYSTHTIIDEEAKIFRLADRLQSKKLQISSRKIDIDKIIAKLSEEQATAFKNLISGGKLTCIDGHAGTGKSHLLAALKEYYQGQGLKVRAFGPDNATAKVLEEKGFEKPENVHRFLFSLHNKKREISTSNEVWVVDEAGKLGNKPLLELLKEAEKNNAQIIFAGSASQISSVERGGFFKLFCEKYGAQSLSNIQRQKFESQRQMAQAIAVGDVSQAIHKLCANGGVHWTQDKEEALQELVHFWVKDTASFPISSALMIARSNQEIRVLNELARQVLKERGLLEVKEYQCETTHGRLFISVGDRVEFRKNDKELGVTNGMSGTLTQASENEFVVLLDSVNNAKKTVKFDPRHYHSYQLGYASTFYRSQGRTVDRAYVLHSPGMNKAEFYVGITRHVRTVHFFVSREQAKSLSHLKWHLNQTKDAFSTVQFTTQKEIDLSIQKNTRSQVLQELKESDRFLERISGYSLTIWDSLKQKSKDYYKSKKDLSANSTFYNPKIETTTKNAKVILVEEEKQESLPYSEIKPIQPVDQPSPLTIANSWTFLSQDKKNALESYYSNCDRAGLLKEIVESEGKNLSKEAQFTPHFREWQEACGLRNAAANELIQTIPSDELKSYFSEQSFHRLVELSDRYIEAKEIADSNKGKHHFLENGVITNKDLEDLAITLVAWNRGGKQTFNAALSEYIAHQEDAYLFKTLSKQESDILDRELKEVPHFREFLQASGMANQKASDFLQKFKEQKDEIEFYFGSLFADYLSQRSSRYFVPEAKRGEIGQALRNELDKIEITAKAWSELSDANKKSLNNYIDAHEKMQSLFQVVQVQAAVIDRDLHETPHFREWQRQCGFRNQHAHELIQALPEEHLSQYLSEQSLLTIKEQAARYQKSRNACEKRDQTQADNTQQNSATIISLKEQRDQSQTLITSWQALSQDQINLLKSYFERCKETNLLLAVIKKESEAVKLSWRAAPHFGDWKTACSMRNRFAYEIEKSFPDSKSLFGDYHEILQERADTYRQECLWKKKLGNQSEFLSQDEKQDPLPKETIPFAKRIETISATLQAWSELSETQKVYLNNYLRARETSAKYHHIMKIQEEVLKLEWKTTPVYGQWRSAFFYRNQKATDLAQVFTKKGLELCLGDDHSQFIEDQIGRCKNYFPISQKVVGEKIDEEACQCHEEKINELVHIRQMWQSLSKEKSGLLQAYMNSRTANEAYLIDEETHQKRTNLAKEVIHSFSEEQLRVYLGEKDFRSVVDLSNGKISETSRLADLPEGKQKAVEAYQQSVREAILLREVVSTLAESQGKDMREIERFKELQKAWGERNKNASQLSAKFSRGDLEQIFGESRAHAIKDQARRFEEFQDKSKKQFVSYEELEKKLLDNAEALLYRLFPEGPCRKERTRCRYGRKGSLCVTISGQKAGSFYDFERQEGGGMLKLIEVSQNLSKQEAESWAKEFLNISHTIQIPKHYQTKEGREQKESQWVSVQPGKGVAPKELSKISSADFLKDYREDTRYPYKDIDGNLLFYTVRLVDKNDSGKKMVLPLSYGHWKNHSKRCHWSFKQYAASDRPLYNLHCLKENPDKPILIVEGEKAANAASKQFPDFVVISWAGGSGAVSKTNWAPLQGRDVLIWPDNDKAGFKAGEQITSELRKLGMKSLKMIDLEKLSREFPEKWDLADSLPDGKKPQDISDMMLLAKEKAINPDHVLLHIQGSISHPAHVAKVNEILWRVDERMRGSLEQLHGNKTWNVNEAIIRETVKIFSEEQEIRSKICKDFGANDVLQDRLAHQAMIFSAEHGKAPSSSYMSTLKEKIRDAAWLQDVAQKIASTTKDQAIQNFVLDNTITQMIEKSAHWNQNEAKNVVDRVLKQVEAADILQQGRMKEFSRGIEI